MKEIISRKIKVVTNAGGMNPVGLKNAIEQLTRVPKTVANPFSLSVHRKLVCLFLSLRQSLVMTSLRKARTCVRMAR